MFINLVTKFLLYFFSLGGPGSGKVAHCERFLFENPGFIHTNTIALLQMNTDNQGSLNQRS